MQYSLLVPRRLRHALRRRLVALNRRLHPPDAGARRLNLGAGRWYHPRWENVDFRGDPLFVDYALDLAAGSRIPLPDGSATLIFSSHCLEHLPDEACRARLAEAHRLLRPGGTLRIVVPDLEKALAAYAAGDEDFFRSGGVTCVGDSLERLLVNFCASYRLGDYAGGPPVQPEEVRERLASGDPHAFARWCAARIPAGASPGGHVNAFDFAKLREMLEEVGFRDIRRCRFRGSAVAELRHARFDTRPRVSLYVEARRG